MAVSQRSPLYLDINQVKHVDVESLALRVSCYGQADHYYPLRRLSRVVVTGNIDWTTSALLACLEYRVPVAFRHRDGRLIGHCVSERSNSTGLESLLHQCVDNVESFYAYKNWLAATERHLLLKIARLSKQIFNDPRAHVNEARIQHSLGQHLPCPLRLFLQQIQAPLASHLSEILEAYGFSDNIHLPLTPRLHPYRDLSRILQWEIYALVLGGKFTEVDSQRGWRYNIVQFYQSHTEHLEQRGLQHLNRLWRNLKHQEAD